MHAAAEFLRKNPPFRLYAGAKAASNAGILTCAQKRLFLPSQLHQWLAFAYENRLDAYSGGTVRDLHPRPV